MQRRLIVNHPFDIAATTGFGSAVGRPFGATQAIRQMSGMLFG
jgi:hypothetical protein